MNLINILTIGPNINVENFLNEATANLDPENPESLNNVAAICLGCGLYTEGRALVAKALRLSPGNIEAQFISKMLELETAAGPHAAWAVKRDAAVLALDAARAAHGERVGEWALFEYLLNQACGMSLVVGPDTLSLKTASELVSLFPNRAEYRQAYSNALANSGHIPQAVEQLAEAQKLSPSQNKAQELNDLQQLLAQVKPKTAVVKGRYPSTEEMREDLKKAVERYVINEIDHKSFNFRLTGKTKFFTMGSCFAREISQRLIQTGYQSFHVEVAEYINSTFANVEMLDWIEGRSTNEINRRRLDDLLLASYPPEAILEEIRNTDLFIYTLGVAPCFFERNTGAFVMPRASALNNHALSEVFDFRTTTVRENVDNLRKIFAFITRHNPSAKFVVTLSPVPLKVTFERKSAVLADCLSKSTLRLAAEEVVASDRENILYWPSFEIVKWLGGHVGPFYGVDDGAAWHVSAKVVRLITDMFVETLSKN